MPNQLYTTSNELVWTSWADCTSNSATNDCTWTGWDMAHTASTSTTATIMVWDGWVQQQEQTQRQKYDAARSRRQATQASEVKAHKAREARKTAQQLLEDNLTVEQREELRKHRYFTVHGQGHEPRRYLVKAGKGRHGNIVEVDEAGRELRDLCASPRGNIPEGDYLLGQKLWLENAEEEFRRVANFTERRQAA